jgi:hypothetical protein
MNHITQINASQRMDMIMKGLNPRDPEEVERYINGEISLSAKERQERAKTLFEGVNNNLGGSNEKDINPQTLIGRSVDINEISKPVVKTEKDYRSALKNDLQSYGTTGKTFKTDDLLSLKSRSPLNESSLNYENITLEGFNDGKKYLNAFITNLQTPTIQNRRNLFKELQHCIKVEIGYKNNPQVHKKYIEGLQQAETAMLNKLQ